MTRALLNDESTKERERTISLFLYQEYGTKYDIWQSIEKKEF